MELKKKKKKEHPKLFELRRVLPVHFMETSIFVKCKEEERRVEGAELPAKSSGGKPIPEGERNAFAWVFFSNKARGLLAFFQSLGSPGSPGIIHTET